MWRMNLHLLLAMTARLKTSGRIVIGCGGGGEREAGRDLLGGLNLGLKRG